MYNKEINKAKNSFFKETIKQITPIKLIRNKENTNYQYQE